MLLNSVQLYVCQN